MHTSSLCSLPTSNTSRHSFDGRAAQPVVANFSVVEGDAPLFVGIVGAGGDVEEMRWRLANHPAAMRNPRGNLKHGGRQIVAEGNLLGDAARRRPLAQIVEPNTEPPKGNIPPVNLRLVDMPCLDDAGIHLRVAELSESFLEEAIRHANQFLE